MAEQDVIQGINAVELVGRVSAAAEERTLPSGDVFVTWRVVVDRPPPRRAAPEGRRVSSIDAIDCIAWTTATRRTAASFAVGDVVRVEGALRRRFWQTGAGAQSRYDVEASAAKRLARAQASR
jgi:single-strand DNA-binding protein